jgi:hypothetical protein
MRRVPLQVSDVLSPLPGHCGSGEPGGLQRGWDGTCTARISAAGHEGQRAQVRAAGASSSSLLHVGLTCGRASAWA